MYPFHTNSQHWQFFNRDFLLEVFTLFSHHVEHRFGITLDMINVGISMRQSNCCELDFWVHEEVKHGKRIVNALDQQMGGNCQHDWGLLDQLKSNLGYAGGGGALTGSVSRMTDSFVIVMVTGGAVYGMKEKRTMGIKCRRDSHYKLCTDFVLPDFPTTTTNIACISIKCIGYKCTILVTQAACTHLTYLDP